MFCLTDHDLDAGHSHYSIFQGSSKLAFRLLFSSACFHRAAQRVLNLASFFVLSSVFQNFFEVLVGGINNLAVDVMGKEGKAYIPVVFGIGLYVAVSNLMALIPGLIPPTSNMNTTAAPAIFVFLLYNFIGIKKHGAGYIKHFLGPLAWLAPFMIIIEFISHLARPLSLTMRLFGNIAGEDLVVVILFMLVPIIVPLPMFFLMIFTSVLQAFVFMMLTMVYIAGALEEAH